MRRSLCLALAACLVPVTGCDLSAGGAGGGPAGALPAVATINAWGSILAQLGGSHVHETSIIANPNTDPHDYEPTPSDGRAIAMARLVVENGVGYDAWGAKAVAANPDPARRVIDVGALVGTKAGGNPHLWYSPADVEKVADAITSALKKLDPADAPYFDRQRSTFETAGLDRYHQLVGEIRSKYAGTPVGASEIIFAPLAAALGLDLVTPAGFLEAISEGSDPSAHDKSAIDRQISGHVISVYVFNSQNGTPDVAAQVTAAHAAAIPVVAITETLSPASASFQDWQVAQLEALESALHKATGR
jgi:zinc/manganese transport system substrate-binding protein